MRCLSVAAILLIAACATSRLPPSDPHPLLGQTPEPEDAQALDPPDWVKVPFPGQVTVVDFWSTHCLPCLAMMPDLAAFARTAAADGIAVLGVATDDNPGVVVQKLRELGVTYPNVLDGGSGALQGRYQVDAIPRTLIFDRAGRLRWTKAGGAADEIRRAARALAAEPP